MRRLTMLAIVVLASVLVCAGAAVGDMSADCIKLVKQGAAMFKEKGKAAALKAIGNPKGPFIKGELYIFAVSMDNKVLAHPFKPGLVGKDVSQVKDPDGKALFAEFLKVAKNPGSGWVEYMWPKPGEDKPVGKNSYIMKVPDEDVYIGAGYYK